MRFSEMRLFTDYPRNTKYLIPIYCEQQRKSLESKPEFNLRLAIRHHRMTIALAMPQREKR
jgi:hypothetical protein